MCAEENVKDLVEPAFPPAVNDLRVALVSLNVSVLLEDLDNLRCSGLGNAR